jgi:hypothetical protein
VARSPYRPGYAWREPRQHQTRSKSRVRFVSAVAKEFKKIPKFEACPKFHHLTMSWHLRMDDANRYAIRFALGEEPKVGAFWVRSSSALVATASKLVN